MTFLFFSPRGFFLLLLFLSINCYKIKNPQKLSKYELIRNKDSTKFLFFKKKKLYNFQKGKLKLKLYSFNSEHPDNGIKKNSEKNNVVQRYLYNLYRKQFFFLSKSIEYIRKFSSTFLKNIKESVVENKSLVKQICLSVTFFCLHSYLLSKHFMILFPIQIIPNHSNLLMSLDLNSTLLVLTTLYFLKDIKSNFQKLKQKLTFGRFKLELVESKKKNIFSIAVLLVVSYVLSGYVSMYVEHLLNYFNFLIISKHPISSNVIKSLQILSGHFVWVISSIVIVKKLLYPYFKNKSNLNFRYQEQWLLKVIYGYMCSHFIFNVVDVFNNFILNHFQSVSEDVYVDNSIDEIVNEKEFLSTFLCIISPCFSAPFFEEYIYRFFVLKSLNLFMGIHYSVFFSSLLFAIHHLNIYNLLPLFFLSFFWSYIYIYTDNILVTMFSKNVSVMANELRSGHIFLYNDKYCEVTDYRQIKQGRLATTNMINYIDLSTLKSASIKFACQAKVEKVEPEKVSVKIQYTDKQKNVAICLDENYADLEIPLNLFGISDEYLEPGLQLNVYKHEDKIIKVNLPSSLLATLRKK